MPCSPGINLYGLASVPPGNDHDSDNFNRAEDTLDVCRFHVARPMSPDTVETLGFRLLPGADYGTTVPPLQYDSRRSAGAGIFPTA
jgi:hypothetical protein